MPFIPPFRTPDEARAPHVVCGAEAASETMQREEAARRAERASKRTRPRNGVDALQEALANGAKTNGTNAEPSQPQHVEGVSLGARDVTRKPTAGEILEHATHAADMAAGFADAVGAEETADILRKGAKVARTVPVAVAGVKREIKPVAEAGKGLWNALERSGYVGIRAPMNMAEMQKRGRK